jgi:6-phosphogluconate dehydrogenase
MGNDAAGHYVKMVHNGIEYAMMQMISEVYDMLRRGAGYTNPALHDLFKKWNEGSLQSFLMEVTADIFKIGDTETEGNEDFLIDKILDQAGSKGTGKWTSQEAMNLPVAIPTIDMAVAMRNLSVYKPERKQMAALYQPAIKNIDIPPEELEAELEGALHFCFVIAYAQGLAMLAKASVELKMDIPLPKVIQVWKAGCIIRSALLPVFEKAFARNENLFNILLDKEVAALLQSHEQRLRRVVAAAIEAKIPLAGMGSALAYFDAYSSERLPTNLIQAQRDYFGAHTYQRIDKPGVFHTEWND